MADWEGGLGQADASEFAHLMLRNLQPDGINLRWEKRVLVEDDGQPRVECVDIGSAFSPLIFRMPAHDTSTTMISFHRLLSAWRQDSGMQTALTKTSVALFVHIDRFAQVEGCTIKSRAALVDCHSCSMPVYSDHSNRGPLGRTGFTIGYVLVGALVSRGWRPLPGSLACGAFHPNHSWQTAHY